MKSFPAISVVIVAGPRRKEKLFACIRSVLHSTYKNFELIVVDNSCDPLLATHIKKKFPRTYVLRMPSNTGIFGYNVGYANAQGRYILSLDDDSTIKSDTLQKIIDVFRKKSKNVAVISLNQYNPIGDYYYFRHYKKLNIKTIFTFVGGACVFRKEMFEKVGYYDPDFFCWEHEEDLGASIVNAGYQIHFEKDIIVNHYEEGKTRGKKVFLIYRNKAWFNIKHFSFLLFPLLILRDLTWFFSLSPLKKNSIEALVFMILGYIAGYSSFLIPLRKRRVLSFDLQKQYVRYYLLMTKYFFNIYVRKMSTLQT